MNRKCSSIKHRTVLRLQRLHGALWSWCSERGCRANEIRCPCLWPNTGRQEPPEMGWIIYCMPAMGSECDVLGSMKQYWESSTVVQWWTIVCSATNVGLGISPAAENGTPLQYSCPGNPMNRGAWWVTVHGVAESDMTEHAPIHFVEW